MWWSTRVKSILKIPLHPQWTHLVNNAVRVDTLDSAQHLLPQQTHLIITLLGRWFNETGGSLEVGVKIHLPVLQYHCQTTMLWLELPEANIRLDNKVILPINIFWIAVIYNSFWFSKYSTGRNKMLPRYCLWYHKNAGTVWLLNINQPRLHIKSFVIFITLNQYPK